MPDIIIPPLPINIPGNQGTVILQPNTGLSYFVPPTAIPGETPPNTQLLPGEGIVTQNIVPGLVPFRPVPPPGPGPAPFAPTDLSGLTAWFRADLGVTISGGRVSAWVDQSGTSDPNKNLSQAAVGQRPTLNVFDAAYSSQPTLSFVSASQEQLHSAAWTTPLAMPETIFIVGNFDGAMTNQYITDGGFNNERVTYNLAGATEAAIYNGVNLSSGVAYSASPVIFAAQFDGVTSVVWVNTLTPAASGDAGSAALTRTGLSVGGSGSDSTAWLNGKVAEVIIYSGILAAPQFASVMNYLGKRYGIPIGP